MNITIKPFFAGIIGITLSVNVAIADKLDDELTPYLSNIYDALTTQSETSVKSCHDMQNVLAETPSRVEIDNAFGQLALDWKRVQSLYVIGDFDDDAIDVPHLIDNYHRGKGDFNKQMARVMTSTDEPQTVLFKNSFKSVNALEYALYKDNKDDKLSNQQREFSKHMVDTICKRLAEIHTYYQNDKDTFLADSKKATAVLLNTLIDNSYKLKEWRLGEPAGLTKKTQGKPHEKYQEYRLSELSIPAIKAILESHEKLTAKGSDLENIIAIMAKAENDSKAPLQAFAKARKLTEDAKKAVANLTERDLTNPEKIKPVFNTVGELNDAYLVDLINSLNDIVAQILDSDGD